MSELKSALKDARNSIKEKNFETALTHCKTALKIDRKNYVALVMIGRVCQELEKYEDSKKALLMCTQLDPDQIPAWKGLSSLHDKCPQIFDPDEALDILSQLATMTNDEEKLNVIEKKKNEISTSEVKLAEDHKVSETAKETPSQSDITETNKLDQPMEDQKVDVSKEQMVEQTWDQIELILISKAKSPQQVEELDDLSYLFAELTIGSREQVGGDAWLRIGLYYLAANFPEKAIRAFQFAVKINPNDSVCFECLGDAYLARGSHNAAFKLYTQAINLNSGDTFYSKAQIACIKQLTGDYLSSMDDYETLLSSDPSDVVRVVALVGVAEVLLSRAQKYQQQNLFANVKSDCMRAMECLSLVASENPHHVTAWKRLSDACAIQAGLPPSLSPYKVPSNLVKMTSSQTVPDNNQEYVQLDKNELLLLGGRFLAVALRISNKNPSLWHDLGVNLFLQQWATLPSTTGQLVKKEQNCFMEMEKALSFIKKSLLLDASSPNAWNSLGVVASFMDNFALAQHAFLKSLDIRPSTEAWTHLGALCIRQFNENLAYEAFSRAQGLDPDYVACWVGQAMVAEYVGHEETFNLFRHTTVLGIHPESCIGHANHVIKSVGEGWKMITNSLIRTASDSMIFYTRDKELDPVGLNMCGLLFEMIGLPKSAEKYFTRAIEICQKNPEIPDKLKNSIYANSGRVLISLDKIEEALHHYSLITEPDFYSECGTALARMKGGDLELAYESYGAALYWLSPDDVQKSHVFVAMALLQYKFKRMDDVKTLLFQSSCSSDNSVQALVSLAALGLLESDRNLFAASLSELDKHSDKKEHAYQIAFLKAANALIKKDFVEAKLIVCRSLHKHPESANLWRFLAQVLLSTPRKNSADGIKAAIGAIAAASKARFISQTTGEKINIQLDVTLKALASVIAEKEICSATSSKKQRKGKKKVKPILVPEKVNSLVEAQRAVLMCPSNQNAWTVLVAAVNDQNMKKKLASTLSKRTTGSAHLWLEGIIAN